jgi:hypothetical protein
MGGVKPIVYAELLFQRNAPVPFKRRHAEEHLPGVRLLHELTQEIYSMLEVLQEIRKDQ